MPDITLPTPGPGGTPGPEYAEMINTAIDSVNDVLEIGRLSETDLEATISSIAPNSAAIAMGNPESDLNVATVALIAENAPTSSLRIVRASLTDLGAARPTGTDPVIWLRPADNLTQPTFFVPETDFIAAASATPYIPPSPIDIFGASLFAFWDARQTPPADGSDYVTLFDRASTPHNMVPLTTGMTDVPQYDADGINGQPALYQPAISAMGVSGLTLGTGALTVIVGVQLGAADGTAQYVTNAQNGGTATMSIATNSAGDAWVIRRGGTVRSAGSIVGGRSVAHAIIATYNGDSSAFWDNGVKTSGILSPGTTAPTAFKLGLKQDIASGDLGPAPGSRFDSAMIVNRAITDDEATQVTAWLNNRMNV